MLSVDGGTYDPNFLATGSPDRSIQLWDVQKSAAPVQTMFGHQFAVRRVKFSPHAPRELISASYDMAVAVWDVQAGAMVQRFDHHTEFVVGVDVSLFDPNLVASGSWDRKVAVWNKQLGRP